MADYRDISHSLGCN